MNLQALSEAESEGAGARRGTRRARTEKSLDRAKERDLGRESESLKSQAAAIAVVHSPQPLKGQKAAISAPKKQK